ncbi:hypothetical protein TVAG_399580 [Trichomonas vaginalis G3]|uniref:Uncharacterized protein n=1 Tax=Trichomonas vaginalis (strain ATCC PRA-98 / G3) TaxID=412133 RepID=A2E5Z5_TRIV3|nr:hypothetical protein TVAGG3_0337480 [Trichomonas vaginalis G3]EAY11952.1 hypothetical protein TVAG_399580 [Trichomonas vaginalis G3]KAI5530383.1 hypothetical protein TVAGG3_0337480 [Trichomonas vaginalis G3]|eukprot:XP_001324175.1 hypothetical protein [Trichomonas vaginalis G3]
MEKRVRFFYPTAKISSETSIKPLSHYDKNTDIYKTLHKKTIESILQQTSLNCDIYEQRMREYIMSQIMFSTNSENNDDFNVLSVQKEAFSKIPPNVCVELGTEYFTIYNPANKKSIAYEYNENLKPILDCLETEQISLPFYAIMFNLECNPISSGTILCNITDYRTDPQIEKISLLTISQELINTYTSGSEYPPETEQDLYLSIYPEICTDPSPDVARVMSTIDSRQKMWVREQIPNQPPDFLPQHKLEAKPIEKHYAPIDVARQVAIPESLQMAFSRLGSIQSILNKCV